MAVISSSRGDLTLAVTADLPGDMAKAHSEFVLLLISYDDRGSLHSVHHQVLEPQFDIESWNAMVDLAHSPTYENLLFMPSQGEKEVY
jgi:hypothetical protein